VCGGDPFSRWKRETAPLPGVHKSAGRGCDASWPWPGGEGASRFVDSPLRRTNSVRGWGSGLRARIVSARPLAGHWGRAAPGSRDCFRRAHAELGVNLCYSYDSAAHGAAAMAPSSRGCIAAGADRGTNGKD
jgi:hypothetical protein